MGGSILKVNVAVAIVVFVWIDNVAFNIPTFIWTNVHTSVRSGSAVLRCYPKMNSAYVLVGRIINFYVPLVITWASNIGIIYKFKHAINKAILMTILPRCS